MCNTSVNVTYKPFMSVHIIILFWFQNVVCHTINGSNGSNSKSEKIENISIVTILYFLHEEKALIEFHLKITYDAIVINMSIIKMDSNIEKYIIYILKNYNKTNVSYSFV